MFAVVVFIDSVARHFQGYISVNALEPVPCSVYGSEPGFLVATELALAAATAEGSRNPGSKARRLLWLQPELALLEAATRFSNDALADQELKGFLICGECHRLVAARN